MNVYCIPIKTVDDSNRTIKELKSLEKIDKDHKAKHSNRTIKELK